MTARELATFVAIVVALTLSLAGCSTSSGDDETSTTRSTAQGAIRLTDLNSVEQLRTRFNDDRGIPRLLLLLSPT